MMLMKQMYLKKMIPYYNYRVFSTISSTQNSAALNLLKDFVQPLHFKITGREYSEKSSKTIATISGMGGSFIYIVYF